MFKAHGDANNYPTTVDLPHVTEDIESKEELECAVEEDILDLDSFVKAIPTSETPGQPEGNSKIIKAIQDVHMGLQEMEAIVGKLDGQAQDTKELKKNMPTMEVQQLKSDNADLNSKCEMRQSMVGRLTKEIKDLRQATLDSRSAW